ncbi:PRC and DUF2382 domain-containing protein [Streptacidiphilus sp. N1-3]|uniref:PRC and DUF2382 domain-containing protein n=1 Tax=Streptacidiphilus alkalitolerans TaxID=3342712 RepID=A0ABV6X5T4_9ACTN
MGTAIDPTQVIGHKVLDAQGHKIGQAEEVYLDDSTGRPQWVTVKGGLFGGKGHFAPLDGASMVEDEVQLACAKSQVDSAPDLETGRHLSVEEERALYQHYGLGRPETPTAVNGMNQFGQADTDRDLNAGMTGMTTSTTGAMAAAGARTEAGSDLKADGIRGTENELTRYEERLHVGTERVEAGHAHLHKYVTTEQVQQTVPLTHQEVRIEREAIPESERRSAMGHAEIAEADADVLLFQERTVVTKETVPVERVRMRVEEVTEDVVVRDEVRTEHIDYQDAKQTGALPTDPDGKLRK